MTAIKEKQLFEEIEILPIDLKTKLVEQILSGLNKIDKEIDELWLNESILRKNDIDNGKVSLVDGDKVFQKFFNKWYLTLKISF